MTKKRQRDVAQIASAPEAHNRLLANQLRAMVPPSLICVSREGLTETTKIDTEHEPSPLVVVQWSIDGVPPDSEYTWYCDACELGLTDEGRNGQCCPTCGRHLEPAAERPRLVVAIRPCIRCGVVYLDKQHV